MGLDLFDIVKERPDETLSSEPKNCPICEGEKLNFQGKHSTLLGWSGEVNPNHVTRFYLCRNCKLEFTVESKNGNVWYTRAKTSSVLKGIPNCFEDYRYTCSRCSGTVTRGENEDSLTFYACLSCGHGGITKQEYWGGFLGSLASKRRYPLEK